MRTIETLTLAALFALTILFFTRSIAAQATSDKWTAPAAEAAKKNPASASPVSIAAGQKIYSKRCLSCHGTAGNGDGPDAVDLGIHPARLSEVTAAESDGALFWKITTGKKPMPRFGGRLSESDRWNVINYVRTLAKK